MKNCNYIIITIIFLVFNLISYAGYAQQTNKDTYIINQYFQLNREATLNLENKELTSLNNIQVKGNYANLKQLGNYNTIDITQNHKNSQTVSQLGNKNYYSHINYYNSSSSNLNIIQQGNSNFLQIYGENSIIKNINIVQKSNFKTLIIKNN